MYMDSESLGFQPGGDVGDLFGDDLVLHRVGFPCGGVAFAFQEVVARFARGVGDNRVVGAVHLQDGRAVRAVGGRGVVAVGEVGG